MGVNKKSAATAGTVDSTKNKLTNNIIADSETESNSENQTKAHRLYLLFEMLGELSERGGVEVEKIFDHMIQKTKEVQAIAQNRGITYDEAREQERERLIADYRAFLEAEKGGHRCTIRNI